MLSELENSVTALQHSVGTNTVEAGSRFEMSAADVIAYCAETAGN